MDVLAGRQKTGKVSGSIFANGTNIALGSKDDAWFKRNSGYVFQDEVFVSNLTVRETIGFSLELRVEKEKIAGVEDVSSRYSSIPQAAVVTRKQAIVQRIVDILGLRKCADSRIGSQLSRGISGGERKRVNIGCELVTSPGILFIDEPTSGLDSTSAYRVMKAVKNLCKNGTTIVCTIHQPRSNIFLMFDHLLLLCGGETVYFGDALKSVEFFSRLGFTCPAFLNPGDFLLDILEDSKVKEEEDLPFSPQRTTISLNFNFLRRGRGKAKDPEAGTTENGGDDFEEGEGAAEGEPGTPSGERLEAKFERNTDGNTLLDAANAELGQTEITPTTLARAFRNSSENAELTGQIKEIADAAVIVESGEGAKEYPISAWQQFLILLRRTWLATLRDPGVMYVRTLTVFGIGLLVGIIFFQQPEDSPGNRTNGILFDMCVFSLICLPSIAKLIDDRLLFTRERAGGYYRTSAYFLSGFFVELPLLFLLVTGYSLISYWMIGLEPTAGHFFFFFGTVQFIVLIMFSITQVISSVAKSVNVALALYFIVLVYSLLLGGFIVSPSELPDALQWALYTSYFYYGYGALVINEYESKSYGPDLLDRMGLGDADKFTMLYILISVLIVLRIAAYCILRFVHTEKR